MKRYTLLFVWLLALCAQAQPRYGKRQMTLERLNRGVVAFLAGNGVVVSWRLLGNESAATGFKVYRDGRCLTRKALREGGTFFVDSTLNDRSREVVYEVRGGRLDGRFVLRPDAPDGYLRIPMQRPADAVDENNGRRVAYSANDASVGDVDGDGQYEVFVKWAPDNSADNSHARLTSETYIDCYRLDGTRLWRINMGRNIRSGAHYVPFIVYDFDGDGRAEMMVRTADGTVDGAGQVIGDAKADYRSREPGRRLGHILEGKEYLTVFDGLTGRALATADYVPERGDVRAWGDDYGNRSDRFLAGVGYLDGRHPSALFCRGYYTRSVLAAWDWDGKALRQHWVFDSRQWPGYSGQGNHNLRVADVDGDGCDEVVYGAMTVDHDGTGLYTTGFGHGDALHLLAASRDDGRLLVWDCHENRRDGSELHDAATGRVLFQLKADSDVGRCMAADIDPTHPGFEMWSPNTGGIRNRQGELVTPPQAAASDGQGERRRRLSCNAAVWWDGDRLRELLDHEEVQKYQWKTGGLEVIQRFDGRFNNGTKSNPCLSADVLGDWREEVLVRKDDSSELRLYVSPIPTEHRMPSLMEDIPYRLGVAMENVGYNQPPELGFYLGE